MIVFVKYWWKSKKTFKWCERRRGLCCDTGLWHSVLRNISICAVRAASVEWLSARGGCLNIHTTIVQLQQCRNTVLWIPTHCQKAIVILTKTGDNIPHLSFVIETPIQMWWTYREDKVFWKRQVPQPDLVLLYTKKSRWSRRLILPSTHCNLLVKWAPVKTRNMFLDDIPERARHTKATSRYRLSRSAGRNLIGVH